MVSAGLVQEEIEGLTGGINSSIQIHPFAADFDTGLIDSPGVVGLLQIRATAFVYFWSASLDPTVDSSVVQRPV